MSVRKVRLPDLIAGLRRARDDDRVRALVAKVGGSRIGLARMQEIREAVADFRGSGKLAVAWAETFGEFTGGNLPYYLATAFDRIYLQPSGSRRAHRRGRRAAVPARRAGQDRHRLPERETLRVQDGRRPADRAGLHRARPGGRRAPGRLGRRAAVGRHRRTPRQARRRRPRPAGPRPVPGRRRPGRGPGRRAGLPGRGVRRRPQARGPGRDPAVRGEVPAGARAGPAGPPAA